MTEVNEKSLAETLRLRTGLDVRRCYQCGKCTAGCPMARYMDLSPSQVMRQCQQAGPNSPELERLLRSEAIWSCAGCLTCTQRCPQELDPAAIIDALREMSYERGWVAPSRRRILAFHEAFLKTVRAGGRMSEVPLVRRYKLASLDLFSDVSLAPVMLVKGKLPLRAHKIAGRAEVRDIFEACMKGRRP